MAKSHIQGELLTRGLRAIAHAFHVQTLFKAVGHAHHQVVQQRPIQAVHRLVRLGVRRTGNGNYRAFVLNGNILMNLLTQRAFGALDRYQIVLANRHGHAAGHVDRKLSDSRHFTAPPLGNYQI